MCVLLDVSVANVLIRRDGLAKAKGHFLGNIDRAREARQDVRDIARRDLWTRSC